MVARHRHQHRHRLMETASRSDAALQDQRLGIGTHTNLEGVARAVRLSVSGDTIRIVRLLIGGVLALLVDIIREW